MIKPLEGAGSGWRRCSAFAMSAWSLLVALVYFMQELLFWNHFEVELRPVVISFFFVSSVPAVLRRNRRRISGSI